MSQAGVAIAILAAGTGTRLALGVPKQLTDVGGRPLVTYAIDAALGSELRPVVLVVGYRAREVERVVPQGVSVVRARGYRNGIAHSLRAALDMLEPWAQVGAVAVGLGDQPLVGSGAYGRLAGAYHGGALLAVATYSGVRSNPVLLARDLWPEARALRGDEGARALMRTREVVEVPCDGTGSPSDVDTVHDLSAIEQQLGHDEE
ncbi:MAG TPA: nucleotidyltransferase family protein [Acidimicrobiia bacterium]